MALDPINIVKSGENCVQITLERSGLGLTITVKANARLEEFMRLNSEGNQVDLKLFSRAWIPVNDRPLLAYQGQTKFGSATSEDGTSYNPDALGHPILMPNGQINLSFLRLVGISEGAGVAFAIKGVYSLEMARQLRDKLGMAAKRFYIDYIRPVDVSVTISTQDLRL